MQENYYITGDKHRNFKSVIRFCRKNKTSCKDVLIILGDAGLNYFGDRRDEKLKKKLSKLKITLFCIHGNKEERPRNIESYVTKEFCGGKVYYEEAYANILFAEDCQIYKFGGREAIVIGGAHSVDKLYRIENGYEWWPDEEPGEADKKEFERALSMRKNKIDYIFSHTVPLKYEPREMFLSAKKKKKVRKSRPPKKPFTPDINKSVEEWLDSIEEKTSYTKWFCAHYHTDKSIDDIEIMFNKIKRLEV